MIIKRKRGILEISRNDQFKPRESEQPKCFCKLAKIWGIIIIIIKIKKIIIIKIKKIIIISDHTVQILV